MVLEAPSRPPVPPSVIADQHQGSKSDFGGEVDIEEAIGRSGCSLDYYRLEECLGEHDRDWRRCQAQVKALKSCNDKKKKTSKASQEST
ncbi:unnamed protein product [Laminaria digitata]